jgi:hypothetical protein
MIDREARERVLALIAAASPDAVAAASPDAA